MSERTARAKRTDSIEREAASRRRWDGWESLLTGMGSKARDKRIADRMYASRRMTRPEQEELWRGDDMAARVVEKIPFEALREGFEVQIQADDGAPAAGAEKKPGAPLNEPVDGEALAQPAETENAPKKPGDDPNAPPAEKKPGEADDGDPTTDPLDPAAPEKKKPRADGFPPHGPPHNGPPGAPPVMVAPAPEKPPGVIEPADNDSRELSEAIAAKLEELGANDAFFEAWCYERAYGGSAVVMGADDGVTDFSLPLNLDNIDDITFLTVLTPRELVPARYYNDPMAAKYGKPSVYRILPETISADYEAEKGKKLSPTAKGEQTLIHESRLIIFPGIKVSRLQIRTQNGWGDSIYNRTEEPIAEFQNAFTAAGLLITDFSQAVFKIKGLADLMATNREDVVRARMTAIDMSRSVARGVLLDADGEDFERKPTPVSGLDALLDRFANRLAAAVDMPVTVLMGQAPAGLNATGKADMEMFYNSIRSMQRTKLLPRLRRLVQVIMRAKNGPTKGKEPENWSIKFNPLSQLTELEQATMRKTQADADVAYINAGVLTPEEVAVSRFGGDDYSTKTTIDFEGRQKLAASYEADKAAMPPPGTPTDPNAPSKGPPGKKPPPGAPPPAPGDDPAADPEKPAPDDKGSKAPPPAPEKKKAPPFGGA